MRPIIVARFLLASGLALLLAGCRLNTRPIVWNTDVQPALVCPGEYVRLSYETNEGECALGSDCTPFTVTVESSDPAITEGLTMRGISGSSTTGPITMHTSFLFSGSGGSYNATRYPVAHAVDVILPAAEVPAEMNTAARCSGDSLVWDPIDLSAPAFRSEAVRLIRVCNHESESVSLTLMFESGSRSWLLVPGRCTEDLPADLGRTVVSAAIRPVTPPVGPVSCTTFSSGAGPEVRLFGILTCDLMTAVAPIVAATTVATATPEIYEIPTLTPEVTQPAPNDEPAATFLQNGNCRQGPGSNYPVITSFLQGDLLHVEGRDSAASWWYLLVPGSTGHCWAAGSNLQLTGPVEQAPVIAAPPTPTVAAPPPPPGKLVISDQVCSDQTYTVTLSWNDVDGNDGYRVFRDGNLIATLGANAASFTDSPPDSGPYTYGVEAFNGAGASSRPTVNEPGCVY
jgi:hypothetical protein